MPLWACMELTEAYRSIFMWTNVENISDDAIDDVAFCVQEVDFAIVLSGFTLYSVDQDNLTEYQKNIAKKNQEEGYMYDLASQRLIHNH